MASPLPQIPAKRYFTIGEVADLCDVKPHVLRYWEQEFTQLRPMKRRGNRRYYQHHEVLMIRRIRELLYEQGFTINGARNRLRETSAAVAVPALQAGAVAVEPAMPSLLAGDGAACATLGPEAVREELLQIRSLLSI
ncbi:transcriptional regulator MirA [Delftia tsuruhatensis]|uniref:MerR family transcriptional regulator n=1 Tax=Delftia tsuruhatensis TaxID=180282 RepID=UPI001E7350C9|nr:MerR family transcriptional regulator [Delftia tsuruhatensis]CAB5716088.1 transcriptional regulator MirA [Delftia tsuruhatensis]CAC9681249.1 transcriptional regulator MirA [Delftia tsuruhatensis]